MFKSVNLSSSNNSEGNIVCQDVKELLNDRFILGTLKLLYKRINPETDLFGLSLDDLNIFVGDIFRSKELSMEFALLLRKKYIHLIGLQGGKKYNKEQLFSFLLSFEYLKKVFTKKEIDITLNDVNIQIIGIILNHFNGAKVERIKKVIHNNNFFIADNGEVNLDFGKQYIEIGEFKYTPVLDKTTKKIIYFIDTLGNILKIEGKIVIGYHSYYNGGISDLLLEGGESIDLTENIEKDKLGVI